MCKKKTLRNQVSEGSKRMAIYLGGAMLVFYYSILEHILNCGTNLISVVSPNMLKWVVIPRVNNLKIRWKSISGATKQVIIKLVPMTKEKDLLVGSQDNKVMTPKKTPEKRLPEKGQWGSRWGSEDRFVRVWWCIWRGLCYPIV